MKRVYKEQGMEDVAGARRVSYSGRGVAGSHRLCLKGQGTISPSPSSISLLSFFYYLAFFYLSGSFFLSPPQNNRLVSPDTRARELGRENQGIVLKYRLTRV